MTTPTSNKIADWTEIIASIASAAAMPLTAGDPMAGAAVEGVADAIKIVAELVRNGVQDPAAEIRRALDIASRVKEQEDAALAALHDRLAGGNPTPSGTPDPNAR